MPASRTAAGLLAGALTATAVAVCAGAGGPAAALEAVDPAAATSAAAVPAGDWVSYHGDLAHTGFSATTPAVGRLRRAWARGLDAAVYASPLVIGSTVVVVTERNSVYGLDRATGAVRWHTGLGRPVSGGSLPCGNIDPLGITGTPAYDPVSRRVFAVATTRVGGEVRHTLVGLAVSTGRVQVRRAVDPPRQSTEVLNQRGALAVSRGRVYVPYGGLAGDCGDYHGHVVGVGTDGRGPLLSYRVPTPREGGIWAPSGIAVDRAGSLYVAVGNGAAGQAGDAYDGSDSVTRLGADLRRTGLFAPTTWREDNRVDADLGSTGPLLLGDGARGYVWIQGKAGTAYVLRQSALGGIGGQVSSVRACERQFGGAAAHGFTVFAACTDGVRKVSVDPAGRARALWRAPSAVSGSPVVGGGAVLALAPGDGVLYALDERTGQVRSTVAVGAVTRFATPALSGALAFVPTQAGITAVALR